MEAQQMHHPEQQQPHGAGGLHSSSASGLEGEGHGEHQHEKKSVMKKVKAKAKKIKDTIKHGLSHEHEHELEHAHGVHEHDDDDEEDEDDEMVQDPEVHGAPIYESSVIRSATVPQQDVGVGPKAHPNLENPTTRGEDRTAGDQGDITRFLHGQEYSGQAGESLSKPTALEAHTPEQSHMSRASGTYSKASDRKNVQGQEGNVGEPVVRLGAPAGVEEDPHAPKDRPEKVQPSNYQSKVTDPTGQRGEAAGVDPLVYSIGKMSVKDETETSPKAESGQKLYTGSHDQFAPEPVNTEFQFAPRPIPDKASEVPVDPETAPKQFDSTKPEEMPYDPVEGYSDKISSAASALSDKAISAKDAVSSKLGYGGTEAPKSHEMHGGERTDVKPSDQSSYTDKITSVIATKATAAKDVIASKLGYGGSEDTTHQGTEASKGSATSVSPTDYAHRAAATVTEALAPVYGKVAGVGSTVMSKVQGTGKGQEGSTATAQVSHEGKGPSMKEYFSGKFAPGEEDKALSEVISDKLHWQKEKTGESKSLENVTESEQVAKRLGTGKEDQREGDDAVIAGSESSGTGVVGRLKEAATSWIRKGGQSQTSQGSTGTTFVNTEDPST